LDRQARHCRLDCSGAHARRERRASLFSGDASGLALAAALSATGLAAVIGTVPGLRFTLMLASAGYLLWLAWSIATSR